MFLELTIILLTLTILFLSYLLYQQKQKDKQEINTLSTQLKTSSTEIQTLKELILTTFADDKATIQTRFDYLDKSFSELNKVFISSKRGMLGNSYLNELLGIILPKDSQVYQLEFTLKKLTEKGDGLRVDAIIFGPEGKNNLAIDSKFPLDNYLLMIDESKEQSIREQAQKDFQSDLKKHVDKTSLYLSEEDSIYQVVMFIPSDAIYLMINELRFYQVIEQALAKKAYLEIAKEFKVSKSLTTSIKKVSEFETTVAKIIKKNEDLMKMSPEDKSIIPEGENITNQPLNPSKELPEENLSPED
ncbi:38909_t:CDS:2 [Gigaspora margarita]|uniref:38909_t:CDS:1 n=1 Tax=Gigaspora margarita TaxID=4874 RepID=A0ABN7UZV4_GIGMA|nr:38909_t:CDS:2 [Gigaspora margarita]